MGTVKIVGHWEKAWRAPLEELNSWIHPLKEFGVDRFMMCPVSGIGHGRIDEYQDIKEVLDNNQDFPHVYVDEEAETDLRDFEHPENALYVFGRTQFSPYKVHFRKGVDHAIKIPSVRNNGGFWGDQTMVVVLYDRFIKEQQWQ